MFHKLRPVDQLRHLLVSNVGGDGEEIERFFKLHQVIIYTFFLIVMILCKLGLKYCG